MGKDHIIIRNGGGPTVTGDGDSPPFLRVVRGDASEEEIAALVSAIAATVAVQSTAAAGREPRSVRENWKDRSQLMRSALHPAPGGWRRSGLPS